MLHSVSDHSAAIPSELVRVLQRVDRLAILLDARYRIPLSKIYFGWDAAVGLVPVAGDLLMAAVSIGLIRDARRLGASRRRVLQMAGHVGIDLLVGAVPIIGPVFDVFYRANLRILELLIEEIRRQASPPGPAGLAR
jgi:hypothetical protein